MKKIYIILLIVFWFIKVKPVFADESVVTNSAQTIFFSTNTIKDSRVKKLESFFEKYRSPLLPYASEFVYWADEYNIDYRLVASISGVESTFGKRIPIGSFNAYGWANGEYKFKSWENSIEHVTKTLRVKYYDKGATNIDKIAKRYAPPSNTWGRNVKYFMNKIDSTPIEFDL